MAKVKEVSKYISTHPVRLWIRQKQSLQVYQVGHSSITSPIRMIGRKRSLRQDKRNGEDDMCDKSITQQIQEVVDDVCQNYCKWPDLYDEEAEGVELADSSICQNCPLNRLV